MSRKPPIFKLSDVRKAFEAARAAGVTARVDITRDGKLSIVPMPAEAPDVKSKDALPAAAGLPEGGFNTLRKEERA
jgi:hypothetical protein